MNATVLIVDDEKLLRQGFIHMTRWEDQGFEMIGEASNGVDALRQIEKRRPHIVVTDIKMPYMDGIELTKKIKERYGEQIQVIVLSSFNDYEYVKETLKSGAVDYVLKPQMQVSELLGALDKAKKMIMGEPSAAHSADRAYPVEIDYKRVKECIAKLDFRPLIDRVGEMRRNGLESESLRRYAVQLMNYVMFSLNEAGVRSKELEGQADLWIRDIKQSAEIEAALEKVLLALHDTVERNKPSAAWSPTVRKVMDYIRAHYEEDISLDSVARQFFLNKSYLSQLFKRNTGETLQSCIARLRIEKAKELLAERDANVNDVGNQVGYANASYFGKVFKSIVGVSPSEYCRQRIKG